MTRRKSVRNGRLRTAAGSAALAAGSAGLLAGSLYVVHAEGRSGGQDAKLAGDARAGRRAADRASEQAAAKAARIADRLGDRTTGAYIDSAGRPVVTVTNATVNFAEGTVTGMIQTTVCAEPGDSGGGPGYVDGPVRVVGSDIYDLDRDGDGTACDT